MQIPKKLSDGLWLLKQEASDNIAGGIYFFQCGRRFHGPDNYRKRILHKLGRDLKLPKLTFRVIRRTIATLAQEMGTVKDVQGLLRHSRAATTTDIYMQEIAERARAIVVAVSKQLRKKPKRRSLTKRGISLRPIAPKLEAGTAASC